MLRKSRRPRGEAVGKQGSPPNPRPNPAPAEAWPVLGAIGRGAARPAPPEHRQRPCWPPERTAKELPRPEMATEAIWPLRCLTDIAGLGRVGWLAIWRITLCNRVTMEDFLSSYSCLFCFPLLFCFTPLLTKKVVLKDYTRVSKNWTFSLLDSK